MIEYIRGIIDELTPTEAVLEANGVGYKLAISLNTYSAIQGKEQAKLYAYESIREDAYQLFGFATKRERELFELLISISGVGGQTARTILSAYSPAELSNIISNEQANMLKSVKGIGLKTAQRIIVELKDKIVSIAAGIPTAAAPATPNINKETVNEAVSALVMLGFPAAAANKVVQGIAKEQPESTVEQLIKLALKQL
jgi:Holliday junction DNA helicase RuvA